MTTPTTPFSICTTTTERSAAVSGAFGVEAPAMNPFDDVTGPGFTSLVVSYSPTLPMLPPALEQQLAISASWFTNPTVGMFQEQLAGPLGGRANPVLPPVSVWRQSWRTCMVLLKSGDRIVSASAVFGTTVSSFNRYLSKFCIAVSCVQLSNLSTWKAAIRPETGSNSLTGLA